MSYGPAIKFLVECAKHQDDNYFDFVRAIALILPKPLQDQLRQLVNGPIWDGDVISKSLRDELLGFGIAIRVCCGGQQGYTGAKYIGYSIVKAFADISR